LASQENVADLLEFGNSLVIGSVNPEAPLELNHVQQFRGAHQQRGFSDLSDIFISWGWSWQM
jgi:hypothetical protein